LDEEENAKESRVSGCGMDLIFRIEAIRSLRSDSVSERSEREDVRFARCGMTVA